MSEQDEHAGEGRSALNSMFSPKSVAVIGATGREGSVGRTVLERLRNPAYRGHIFPVNPNRTDVLGLAAYPKIGDVPEEVDLAVIVTPAKTVPAVVGECVDAGVRAAAAEFDVGRATDGANEDLPRTARRTGPRGCGHGRVGKGTHPLQPDGDRATVD